MKDVPGRPGHESERLKMTYLYAALMAVLVFVSTLLVDQRGRSSGRQQGLRVGEVERSSLESLVTAQKGLIDERGKLIAALYRALHQVDSNGHWPEAPTSIVEASHD